MFGFRSAWRCRSGGPELFARKAQVMVGIEPNPKLAGWWDRRRTAAGPAAPEKSRKVAQLAVSWDSDDRATGRAHELFRWKLTNWEVNAELPSPAGFAGVSETVRPADVAEKIPCGHDVGAIVKAAKEFFDAGCTDLPLVEVGGDQQDSFFRAATTEILPELTRL